MYGFLQIFRQRSGRRVHKMEKIQRGGIPEEEKGRQGKTAK